MQFTCEKPALVAALRLLKGISEKKEVTPILQCVKIKAGSGVVNLFATDLEVSGSIDLYCAVKTEGECAVNATVLTDFVGDLESEEIEFKSLKDSLKVSGNGDHTKLQTSDVDEFPERPDIDGEEPFASLDSSELKALIESTSFAAAKKGGRYAMEGVLFEVADDSLKLVGTDGRRLSVDSREIAGGRKLKNNPVAGARPLRNIAKGLDGECSLISSGNYLFLHCCDSLFSIRKIDGDFPKYGGLIEEEYKRDVSLDRAELNQKLKLVGNVCSDESSAIQLRFGKNKLEVFGKSSIGEGSSEMELKGCRFEETVSYSEKLLREGLSSSKAGDIRFRFNDASGPANLQLGERHQYLLMPISQSS